MTRYHFEFRHLPSLKQKDPQRCLTRRVKRCCRVKPRCGPFCVGTVDDKFEAIPGRSFLAMLHCPQPATIKRQRKVAINPPPHGKRRSAARGCYILTCETTLNHAQAVCTLLCISDSQFPMAVQHTQYHLISKNILRITGKYLGIIGDFWRKFSKELPGFLGE